MLQIIQEYLNKNRYFIFEKIIPYINVRVKKYSININYAGIREILKSLIKKKQILEKSKLTKEDVLDNNNRKRIHEFIIENPGVYFNQIAKKLNLSNYILAWHLKILLKFSYIRSKEIDKHEVFFSAELSTEKDGLLSFITKEKVKKLIDYLKYNQEGCSKTQVSKELHMHFSTVNKYLEKLDEFGIIVKKRFSSKTLFFLSKKYYKEIEEKSNYN